MVYDLDAEAFVHVHRRGLGDQQPAGGEKLAQPVEQRARVTADAEIAVHEERGVPAAFRRHRFEDGTAQRLSAEPGGVCDGGLADVYAESTLPLGRERRDQPPGPASDVEHGALAPAQHLQIDRVGGRAPALHVQGKQPAVGAAQEEGATAGAQGIGVGVAGGPRGRGDQ
ncbi:hypothetical protein SBI_01955 [Streptomyces bingchenggensis BCW-1]|uniref:Uncharacterized protein n=1 Tax=Streptomyces bingchenggensis (strain BCW-1) TaxID=749414 RepID=D7BRB3_STRBB|nr:hypothetical protein SBI_01955 [Streptomyces bingchenggensis BCW-1]